MAKVHRYTLPDLCYACTVKDGGLLPSNASYDDLPPKPWLKQWPQKKVGTGWEMVEDHRERKVPYFPEEFEQEGTPYWLPEDDWQSQPRAMKEAGPLPAGAVLKRPEKPVSALAEELRNRRNTRIITTDYLMMVDYPLSTEACTALTAYRQALRDLPQVAGFPWAGGGPDDAKCPWPVLPATLTTSTPKTT